jgi:hypothetical protein
MLRTIGIAIVVVTAAGFADQASAALKTYTFENITSNNGTDAAIGEAQMRVDVFDQLSDPLAGTSHALGDGEIGFRFRNEGPLRSSITAVFFEDGGILKMHVPLIGSAGVEFSQDNKKPANLPGGNAAPWNFEPSSGFENIATADADAPMYHNGINPNEWLIVKFELEPHKDYDDVITALATRPAAPGTGTTLRIGIKVQGYTSGGSESFINEPGQLPPSGVVPEPATLAMWSGLGLLAGCGALRRGRRRAAS